jgi:hypothetical protein
MKSHRGIKAEITFFDFLFSHLTFLVRSKQAGQTSNDSAVTQTL